jgi:hypothetical protein
MEGGDSDGQEGKESSKEDSQEGGKENEKVIRRGWTSSDGLSLWERNQQNTAADAPAMAASAAVFYEKNE